jgi:putative methyltransferase (TIGR04325 family)
MYKKELTTQFAGKIWDGIYKDFKEANKNGINIAAEVWDNQLWMDKQILIQKQAIEKSNKKNSISELAFSHDYCLPYILSTMNGKVIEQQILDYGGGLASTYMPVKSMLPPNYKFKFTIVENEVICIKGNEIFKNDKKINFVNYLPLNQKFDVIHLGSSMHYVEDYKKLFKDFYKIKPKYLIFADLPAGDIQTFVTNQNFNQKKIPVRFWNLQEFIKELEEIGFKLIIKSRYKSNYIEAMKSFPKKYRLEYFSQLVFSS